MRSAEPSQHLGHPATPGPPAAASTASTSDTPLTGPRVALVPVGLVARDHLYEIATCTSVALGWEGRGRVVSPERFDQLVGGELSYAIVHRARGEVAGHVGLVDVDPWSGTGRLVAFVDPRHPLAPLLAGEAVGRFLAHAFRHGGIRKVTVEVPSGPASPLGRLLTRGRGLTLEGTLRRHVRLGTRLVDVDVYAVWAEPHLAAPDPGAAALALHPVPVPLTAAALARLVAAVAPGAVEPGDVRGHHRLVDDLGYDSLALLELVDALDLHLGPEGPLDLDDVDHPVTVDHLLGAGVSIRR